MNDIPVSEDQFYRLDSVVYRTSLVVSVAVFVILFLVLFAEKLSYIRTIIDGIDTMRGGELGHQLPLEGNNELTQLAEAVNYLSATEKEIKEKERALNEEKETLIRTLSHDIRTPLTSILSYSELLMTQERVTAEEEREYRALVRKKAMQIKELTDILLDGGRREVEWFDDARLLFEQLAGEFEETLEEEYRLSVDLSGCTSFAGGFDVLELRRIFDNLISNVRKYADTAETVALEISRDDANVVIRQRNAVHKSAKPSESHRMGLNSIRRIAHHYGGTVRVEEDGETFEITITLSYR